MKAVFPGSFCPPTAGHLNIIERASKLFDKLVVGVGVNSEKTYAISASERVRLLQKSTQHLPNVEVLIYDGFTTDFCEKIGAGVLVKSVRNALDLQQIIDIERITSHLWDGETLVLLASKEFENISSSLVREFVDNNKDISGLVDEKIKDEIVKLLKKNV